VDVAIAQAVDISPVKSKLAQAIGAIEVIAKVLLAERPRRTLGMKHFNRHIQSLFARRFPVIPRRLREQQVINRAFRREILFEHFMGKLISRVAKRNQSQRPYAHPVCRSNHKPINIHIAHAKTLHFSYGETAL
jgi:hypothetical protein